MQFCQSYIDQGLPQNVVFALYHFGAKKIPHKKYQKAAFKLCLENCACWVVKYYNLRISKACVKLIEQLIEDLLHAFRDRIRSVTVAVQTNISFDTPHVDTSTDSSQHVRPPPNL